MNLNGSTAEPVDHNRLGGIILCGGKSRRMGIAKSELPFGDQSMIELIVDTLTKVTEYCVVVGVVNESLKSALQKRHGSRLCFRTDENRDCGPLEGIRVGLDELQNKATAAFVTSCDVPLLKPALVKFLYSRLESYDAVIPRDGTRIFGLTAVYRTSLLPILAKRVAAKKLRVSDLAGLGNVLSPPIHLLSEFDSGLESIININEPGDYLRLLAAKGLQCPDWVKHHFASC